MINLFNDSRKQSAFTLIELLVVVAVLALLASIVFSNLTGAREQAKISNALSFQSNMHNLLGADLVGWWNFDDEDNRYKDLSGYGNNGSCTSCPTLVDGVPGTSGKAMSFNGSGDFINIPVKMNNENFGREDAQYTFSGWIKLNKHNTTGTSVIFGMAYYNGFGMMISSDGATYTRISTYFRNVTGVYTTNSVNLEVDRWYHIISVLDKPNLQIRLFIDGNLVHQRTITNDEFLYVDRAFQMNGASQPSGNGPWARLDAVFDDFRIYSQVLDSSQIKQLYARIMK